MFSVMLFACVVPPTKSPPPTPLAIRIAISPAVGKFSNEVYACADSIPGLTIFLDEIHPSQVSGLHFDLSISFQVPPIFSPNQFQLSSDSLKLVVNHDNPILELSKESLVGIFNGYLLTWNEVSPSLSFSHNIQIVRYPSTSELDSLFQDIIGSDTPDSTRAIIAPNPKAMLELVAKQPGAIGYVPASWLEEEKSIKPINLDPTLEEKLRLPVLAGVSQNPDGPLAALIDCLQQP